MSEPGLTVLVAARDEVTRIGRTVTVLREAFPEAEIVVADDGSRDATASAAVAAGARVVRLSRRGKGQALTLAERECRTGPLLLCDADLDGDLRPLVDADADVAVARFARKVGGGLGLAKGTARATWGGRSAGSSCIQFHQCAACTRLTYRPPLDSYTSLTAWWS